MHSQCIRPTFLGIAKGLRDHNRPLFPGVDMTECHPYSGRVFQAALLSPRAREFF
jgi:hypothetical protein